VPNLIKVQRLSRRYQDLLAVDDVSFQIQQGEVVGLLGHNGAGKTTVMKMLTGFLAPSDGSIEIDSHLLPQDSLQLQSKLGYLPEVLPVYPEMSVIDFLEFIARMRNIPEDLIAKSVIQAIEETDLNAKALAKISTLSRGYKQRVGVASAIIHKPKVLILDEPTNGLDPEQTHHMRDLIQRLSKNSTVILSTHIMQEVEAICSRVLILQSGRLTIDESLQNLRQTNEIILLTNSDANNKINDLLRNKSQIISIDPGAVDSKTQQFTLKIIDNTPIQDAINETARALINEGVEIYSIAPKQSNLENVVRKLHRVEVTHAS
jgi:ABC-2 type transport system ATP-binding protein